MIIKRTIERVVKELNSRYPVVIFTGMTGTGKTTLLRELEMSNMEKLSLSDKRLRVLAEERPADFVKNLRPPVIIREIQYGLNLMPYINQYIAKHKEKGQFCLVGTHMCDLFDSEGASLGENIGIVRMTGLTYEEITGVDINLYDIKNYERNTVKNQILRGGMPALYGEGSFQNRDHYFDEYVQEFLRTEVKAMAKVSNIMLFRKFMCAAAKRSGELINYANLSKDINISQPTAKQWMSILIESGIVGKLLPFMHKNLTRAVDVPRFYFLDSGLCSYLANEKKAEKLFKTWVIGEVAKRFYNLGIVPPIYHYRDKDGKEVDLIIKEGNLLHPIKIDEVRDLYQSEKLYYNGFSKKQIPIAPWQTITIKKK